MVSILEVNQEVILLNKFQIGSIVRQGNRTYPLHIIRNLNGPMPLINHFNIRSIITNQGLILSEFHNNSLCLRFSCIYYNHVIQNTPIIIVLEFRSLIIFPTWVISARLVDFCLRNPNWNIMTIYSVFSSRFKNRQYISAIYTIMYWLIIRY